MINKRTAKLPWTGPLICFWLVFFVAPITHGADLAKAWSLHKEGKYLESIALSSQYSEEGIYLIYLNEEEIGGRADYSAQLPDSPKAKYYQYVKQNPTLFFYNEAAGGTYETSEVRYEQIKKLNPVSKYVGIIEFDGIKSFHDAVWEDGDGSSHSKELISDYEGLIKRFPKASFVPDARSRIEQVKRSHKRVAGKDL